MDNATSKNTAEVVTLALESADLVKLAEAAQTGTEYASAVALGCDDNED